MCERPELNTALCNGCGLCVLVCQGGGLIIENSRVKVVESIECDFCGDCESVCLTGALNLRYQIVRTVIM
jgi:NAD-dependent dihydropyrimidine dehydrogenase PreA subunit